MRPLALALLLCLAACSRNANTIDVTVVDQAATSARLRLCGEEQDMTGKGNRFSATLHDACEGEGDIVVSFADHPPISCRIGYVTPGMAQAFRFTVQADSCMAA